MRKLLSTALVVGLTTALLGCPPPEKKTPESTDKPPTDAPADTPAETPTSAPADAPAETPAKADSGVDISHVKVGQKYTIHMNQSGMEMDMVWEVKEITPAEIKYTTQTIMNGNAVGDPSPVSWPLPAKPAATTGDTPPPATDAPKPAREKVSAAGMEWDCLVTTSGDMKTYTSMSPGSDWAPTFPGLIKQMKGDQVTMELTKIE